MKPKKQLLTMCSVLLITALLAACGSPAAAPTSTPMPPTATAIPPAPTPVPPTPAPTPIPPTPEPAPVAEEPAAAAAEPEAPHGIRFDAPEYAIDGPYAVGVRYFTIPAAAENDRDLTVSVWYPAQQSDSTPSEMVYEQQFAPGEIPAFTVLGHAQLDAPPDASGAPYPLVVYSHSHWSFGQENPYIAEHLASRGFVVVSTDHADNWSTAFGPIAPESYLRRPQEITRQIDFVESLSLDGGSLSGLASTEKVGVAGWSQGAMTALAAGGARLDLANAAVWCQENPESAELNPSACPDMKGRESELAAFADMTETPEGLWPDWSDERVGAVVALAPSTIPFGNDGIQQVDVPVMFMVGSGETSTDGGFEMASPYESVASVDKAKVVFDYAEHLLFVSSCADSPNMVELGFPMFCVDPVWDMDRAHDLINHFATAFLLAELKGDAEAAKALAPENVDFPGIKYESTGYGAAAAKPATTPEVFVQGAPVRLPVGLAVGPDDNLYVGSQWVRSLPVLNPETGEILKSYGPEDGVDIPADLAFGPDGSLYASMYPGYEGDSVMRMAPDGTVTSMALPPIIWPVMTTQDGRLFAALLLENDMIVELDPDFEAPQREVVSDGNFIHMREGPDGMIYALRWFDGEIVRFDPDAPDEVETVATGLTLPFNLAFDSMGQLYIIMGIDESTDAVARLDLETGEPEVLVTMKNLLYGLAIDSKDRIFVSSVDDGTIFEVLPEGDIRIVSPGGMILPSDVEVIARPDGESLFLADWGAWREYDTATGELRSTRHGTWWPGTLTNPDTIAPFGDYLLLASSENQQIQIWDPVQQKEVLLIDYPGVNNAIGFDDAIVATSHETKDVVRIDPKDPDQRTVLASGLEYPLGLAVDAGNLYVGDFLTGQILQVAADGVTLDPPKLVAEGLQGPEGLALTGDGRLLVVESAADRLSLVDLSSGEVTPLATDLGIMRDLPRSRPLHYFFNGVDVSPSGMVYVTADDANAIYRIPLPKPAVKLDDATTAKIEALVEEIMASGQVPGAAVGIVKDGQLVYAKGFGVTELGGDEPVTADSVFGMASVAKSPVGMAVMQLVEAGKIDLDAPVTEYLPDFTMADPDGGAITIRQLLSHTSGMPDPVDRLAEYQDENTRTDEAALGDYVRTLSDDSLTFRPGEEWSYSDTGFDVLGDVVAKVSGQTFEDYMQANILTPLGMKDSSYLVSDLDPAQLVAPHMYDENGNARTLDFYPYSRAHAPSASFYSSVNDMARLAIANMNQGTFEGAQVLPATAYDKMWAPQAASTWAEAFGPQVTNYGLGWWVGEFNGHTVIGNYGADVGFQSHLGIFPDDGIAVIALVNLFDPEAGSFYAYDIGNGVAETLLGAEAEPATQP